MCVCGGGAGVMRVYENYMHTEIIEEIPVYVAERIIRKRFL